MRDPHCSVIDSGVHAGQPSGWVETSAQRWEVGGVLGTLNPSGVRSTALPFPGRPVPDRPGLYRERNLLLV